VQQAVAQLAAGAKPFNSGKFRSEIAGEPVDDFCSPASHFLAGKNVASDGPVEQDQLAVHRKRGADLCRADTVFDVPEERRITTRRLNCAGHWN
jgi:hypothetical protein